MTAPESAATLPTPKKKRPSPGPQFPAGGALAVVPGRWHGDRVFRLGFGPVTLVLGAAALAPWLALHDPRVGDLQDAYLLTPGGDFLPGTDTQGRDGLSHRGER